MNFGNVVKIPMPKSELKSTNNSKNISPYPLQNSEKKINKNSDRCCEADHCYHRSTSPRKSKK